MIYNKSKSIPGVPSNLATSILPITDMASNRKDVYETSKTVLQASTGSESTVEEESNVSSEVTSITRYFHIMEKRVRSLEDQLAKLTGSDIPNRESDPGIQEEKRKSSHLSIQALPRHSTHKYTECETIEMHRDAFDGFDIHDESLYAIELCIENGFITRLRIRSQELLEILQPVLGPDLVPNASQSVVMMRPFKALMRYKKDLEELSEQSISTEKGGDGIEEPMKASLKVGQKYLDLLVNVFKSELYDCYTTYSALRERSVSIVSFVDLWCLFHSGDIVVERSRTPVQAYRVLRIYGSVPQDWLRWAEGPSEDFSSTCLLTCFSIGYDGKSFGPILTTFTIPRYLGSRDVNSLPILPIESFNTEIETEFVERGKKFWSIRGIAHQKHSGISLDRIPKKVFRSHF